MRISFSSAGREVTNGCGVVGWACPATSRLDVRVGGGVQWMRYESPTTDIDTPFVTLDLVVGWRLAPPR